MQDTPIIDDFALALLDLVGFFNSAKRDEALMKAAGVTLDRALFPLLARLGLHGALSVAGLADQVGRDHTTVSRQLATLERLGLIERRPAQGDRRVREARLTNAGRERVEAIARTRRAALSSATASWSEDDKAAFTRQARSLVEGLSVLSPEASQLGLPKV